MARSASQHPTDGELELLQVLWERGPSALGEICTAIRRQRQVATTTIATVLKVMHDKGLVRRKKTGKGYQWSAAAGRQSTASGMVGKLIERVFEGSAQQLVAHLVEEGDLSQQELDELRAMLDEHASLSRKSPSQQSQLRKKRGSASGKRKD